MMRGVFSLLKLIFSPPMAEPAATHESMTALAAREMPTPVMTSPLAPGFTMMSMAQVPSSVGKVVVVSSILLQARTSDAEALG